MAVTKHWKSVNFKHWKSVKPVVLKASKSVFTIILRGPFDSFLNVFTNTNSVVTLMCVICYL